MTPSTQGSGRYDVIVIGAGHNGLAAAALLGKSGRKVLVVERRAIIGGVAAGEEFHPEYRTAGLLHDSSTLCVDMLSTLQLARHGLSLTKEPAAVFMPHLEGPGLLLSRDAGNAGQELGASSNGDAKAYAEYRTFLASIRNFVQRLLGAPPPDLYGDGFSSLMPLVRHGIAMRRLGRDTMMELMRIVPMPIEDYLNERFESDVLKAALAAPGIYGTFMGPRSPGGMGSLLRYECMAGAAVVGGPASLIAALESSAESHGVEIRTSAEVVGIRDDADVAVGVTLADGNEIDASVVVSSCDPKRTISWLRSTTEDTVLLKRQIQNFRTRGTTAKVNLALSGPLRFSCRPDLTIEHARIGETLDYLEHAFDAVKYRKFSESPILDICVPTVAAPDLAPAGHSVASILVHFAPHHLDPAWDNRSRDALGDTVVATLERYAPNIRKMIVGKEVLTPADIADRYGLSGGHIYQGEHGLDQLLIRPTPQCVRYETPIKGLFLGGSGSHPGGGITCAPGVLAAKTVIG